MVRHRTIDISKDKYALLEYHCEINYEYKFNGFINSGIHKTMKIYTKFLALAKIHFYERKRRCSSTFFLFLIFNVQLFDKAMQSLKSMNESLPSEEQMNLSPRIKQLM